MKILGKSSARKFLVGAGYAGFTLVALLFGLYLTFPAEAVGQRLAHEVRARSGGEYALSYGAISSYRLTGFAAERVHLRAGRPGQQPIDIELDELRLRLRLLPLLLLRLSAEAAVGLGDGTIDAAFTPRGPGALDASLAIDDLSLASPPLLPKLVGLPLAGKIDGEARAAWRLDSRASTGKARFSIANASFGPGSVSGLTVPLTHLGTLSPELVIEAGRLRISSFKQQGGEVQLKISGSAQLRPRVGDSSLDLCVLVKPDPAFLSKNPTLASALQLAEVRFRKDAQGFLNVPVGGTLQSPIPHGGLCSAQSR